MGNEHGTASLVLVTAVFAGAAVFDVGCTVAEVLALAGTEAGGRPWGFCNVMTSVLRRSVNEAGW